MIDECVRVGFVPGFLETYGAGGMKLRKACLFEDT